MHKKDRPMLSVTSLLYRSPAPNSNALIYNNIHSATSPNGSNSNGFSMSNTGGTNGITSPSIHHSHQTNNTQIQSPHTSSPTGSIISPSCDNNSPRYPPNHPLSGSKHLCAICEDRASGKHYGVYSCEGCKGFFKRTVRKDLTYVCRDEQNCIVDKKQRNRCQYCRYQKCLEMGMKREAVQEERQRNKPENEPESSTNSPGIGNMSDSLLYQDLNIERLTEAEKFIEITSNKCLQSTKIATKEIELLFLWIKHIPYFNQLHSDDQMTLLKGGWNELLIAEFSYRSICKNDALLLANGVEMSKSNAQRIGIGDIFDRVLKELVTKMREMQMDQSELGCLRAIVLFNPAMKNLKNSNIVEKLRDRVYSILENHCRNWYHHDKTSRFAKLLVRLPALRSIGLKCVENLFFQQFLEENNRRTQNIDSFIIQMLNLDYESIRQTSNNHNSLFYQFDNENSLNYLN